MSASPPVETDASGAVRRASGRVRKQPEHFTSSPFSNSGKRKRGTDDDGDVQMPDDYVSDEEQSSEEEEPDEEEVREQSRKARKPKSTAPKKPTQKKPKVNGTALPIRSAAGGKKPRAPKKGKAVNTADAEEAGGLFAEVFASDKQVDVIAAGWLKGFEAHESQALADLVNFVLRCAGCHSLVSDHDVEDPDGVTNRLTDIQDEFQATAPTEYPLIGKGKAGTDFKQAMSACVDAIIKSIAASGKLYSNAVLIENIEIWLSTMSSAGNRAFRHTATVASLSVITSLAGIAGERAKAAADWKRQADTERAKKNFNRGRVKELDSRVKDATQAQEFVEEQVKDWFDTVFIHRYRDVDPAIRRDCAIALTDWIMVLPDYFFDGQHLRYLGWVLSDTVSATRGEVVKQLQRLYKEKDKIGGLKTFTERFRPRMVEIATTDAESGVRASGIELLDILRESELLEPDEIDAIGRLIYDSDIRVRKVVAVFFAEIVNGLYGSKVDDLDGIEALEEVLPEVDEENFETPRLEWLKFKSVAEMMVAYDQEDDLPSQVERNRDGGLALHAVASESRFSLAAEVLYSKIEEIQDWQSLSGYLLFDHSSGRANGVADDTLSRMKHECILSEKEEVVLLEVIGSSVKHTIIELAEKSSSTKNKLTKKQKQELSDEQEEAARHLAGLIPKLLKKFGDVPSTAAAVLRMESVLNLPSLRDLRQDSATYGALLDDIRKQFMSHSSDEVLGPASEAILHAKSYGELDDLTEEKLGMLWEDVINNLAELLDPDTVTVRGASDPEQLIALSNNLLRITRLAQVSNCTVALEDSSVARSNEATGADYQGAIDYIIGLIQRALPATSAMLDPEDGGLEDEVAARASEAALRYLEWKIYLIQTTVTANATTEIPYAELEALATRRDQYVSNLDEVLQSRKAGESISVTIAGHLLELHTSAVILKNIKARPGMRDDWDVLIMNLNSAYLKMILKVFSAAEKNFANLSNKKLEDASSKDADVDIDADPMDDDPISESESEDEDEPTQTQASQLRKENKLRKTVMAEKTLCELTGKIIYAIHAGVEDGVLRKRLGRNRLKLGPNYKELLNYMDIGQKAKNTKSKSKAKTKPAVNGVSSKSKANPKSNAIVAEDELDEDIEDEDAEEAQRAREMESVGLEDGENVDPVAAEAESVLGD